MTTGVLEKTTGPSPPGVNHVDIVDSVYNKSNELAKINPYTIDRLTVGGSSFDNSHTREQSAPVISTIEDAISVSLSEIDVDMLDDSEIREPKVEADNTIRQFDFARAPKVIVQRRRCAPWFLLYYDRLRKIISLPIWQDLLIQWYALEKSSNFQTSVNDLHNL